MPIPKGIHFDENWFEFFLIFQILINSNSTSTRKPEADKSRLEPNNAQSLSTPNSPNLNRTGSRISSPNPDTKNTTVRAAVAHSKALNPEVALREYNKNRASGKPLINLVVVIVINLFFSQYFIYLNDEYI